MAKDIIVSDPMDQAILDLVKSLPNIWKMFEFDTLSSTQQEALKILVGAGMVEQRNKMRLRMIGEPQILFITFRITGECGLSEVGDKIAAAVPNWRSAAGNLKNQLLSERDSQFQMRLTDQGDIAQGDIMDGLGLMVLHFVKKIGRYAGRETVAGHGIIESLEIKDTSTTGPVAFAQAHASIGEIKINNAVQNTIQVNNDAVASAISTAFEKLGVIFQNALSSKETQSKSVARKTSKSDHAPKRSWTTEELEEAIRDYRAERASTLQEFVSILDNPKTSLSKKRLARKNAIKLFGRNVIARALGVKSAKMVGDTMAWKAVAGLLGLPRKTNEVTRKYSIREDDDASEPASRPRSATKPYSEDESSFSPDDILMQKEREETLKYIRRLAHSMRDGADKQAASLFSEYDAGLKTDEQVRAIVDSLLSDD